MKNIINLLATVVLCGFLNSCFQPNTQPAKIPFDSLVWSDEFDYSGQPDPSKWTYDIGDGCPLCGWGNNELEYYTDNLKNVRVENGLLTLELHKDSIKNSGFTSGRIKTKGKADWLYGRFEIKAKLPSTLGTWPAIWMLPSKNKYGNWPQGGEIDIMENVGYDPDTVLATVHTGAYNHMRGTQKGSKLYVPDCDESFHVYKVEWEEKEMRFYIDDIEIFKFDNEGKTSDEWPFDQPYFLIMNVAFGGNWGGQKGLDTSELPVKMQVDYVRVYQ